MKALNYLITNEASIDLNDIWHYTFENWSKKQADLYHSLIISEIKNLAKNPNIGQPKDSIVNGLRSRLISSHTIFYNIGRNERVEVLRILHSQMDITKKFNL